MKVKCNNICGILNHGQGAQYLLTIIFQRWDQNLILQNPTVFSSNHSLPKSCYRARVPHLTGAPSAKVDSSFCALPQHLALSSGGIYYTHTYSGCFSLLSSPLACSLALGQGLCLLSLSPQSHHSRCAGRWKGWGTEERREERKRERGREGRRKLGRCPVLEGNHFTAWWIHSK